MGRLPMGKIPIAILDETVLKRPGAKSDRVVNPPKAGVDFAAVKVGRGVMVVSADPITGIKDNIGRYAVKVSANDVATSGNRPQFAESVIMLPSGSSRGDLQIISRQIHEAAKESGIAILGGHTEVTPELRRPIVVVTTFSFVDRFVTSTGARDGDSILMTKTAGLEGTSELAERAFSGRSGSSSTKRAAKAMIRQIDVTEEAVAAFKTGRVHAMHDCTEGGVLGAVFEMSLASGLGFELWETEVPVAKETTAVCEALSLDPLRLIGSGSLLIAVAEGSEGVVEARLRPVCRVTKIGRFRRGAREVVTIAGKRLTVKKAPEDELWRVLSRQTPRSYRA